MERIDPLGRIGRRAFVKGGSAAGLGLGFAGSSGRSLATVEDEPRVRRYSKLGKTGLSISDVSFGSSRSTDPDLVRHAVERGINYFDSAESYKGGRSEEMIGEGIEGRREQVILTSKTHADAGDERSSMMRALEASLGRLRTDHVDVYFNHAVNDPDRMKNEEWHEFVALAKKQGKIRFSGMSGHGGRLVESLDYALDHDLVDVVLVAHNFGQDPAFYERLISRLDFVAVQPGLPRVLDKARDKGVGVVAMKTLRGAKLNDMRPYEAGGSTFAQAAFRWTLAQPNVDALIISMTSKEQIDEYLGASGAPPPTSAELDLLEEYLLAQRGAYCNHGCSQCESSCPAGVPISEVLRTRMYAVDYGDLGYARSDYAALRTNAEACVGCTGSPCQSRCPIGVPIPDLTRAAHALLA